MLLVSFGGKGAAGGVFWREVRSSWFILGRRKVPACFWAGEVLVLRCFGEERSCFSVFAFSCRFVLGRIELVLSFLEQSWCWTALGRRSAALFLRSVAALFRDE